MRPLSEPLSCGACHAGNRGGRRHVTHITTRNLAGNTHNIMATYNTIPSSPSAEETLLQQSKISMSRKGLAGAAVASFVLAMVAAYALTSSVGTSSPVPAALLACGNNREICSVDSDCCGGYRGATVFVGTEHARICLFNPPN